MTEEGTRPDFYKLTETQRQVGDFLRAFDPILTPLESLAKHGITLSTGFLGITATFVAIFKLPQSKGDFTYLILFFSWLMFLATIVTGTIQLWRTTRFRDQMRKFAYVLLGDIPDDKERKEALKIIKQSYDAPMILEYIFLLAGVILFASWAITQFPIWELICT